MGSGAAPPRNVLDFYSLKSPFLGFRVIQAGCWPDFNLESVFIIKNIFNMKNVTDFRKAVETGVDPRQLRFYHFEPKSIVLGYFNTVPDTKYEHLSDM